MSAMRISRRGIAFSDRCFGELKDWTLVFDKRSDKDPSVAFANITPDVGRSVEGVVYRLELGSMLILDRFEGAPVFYRRFLMPVSTAHGDVHAWAYVATEEWRCSDCRATADYLRHLVDGADLLSAGYRQALVRRWLDAGGMAST